jgi:proline dehydrogenase
MSFFSGYRNNVMENNRTPSHLFLALVDAYVNNYALGVKLVRGAYHPYEIAAHEAVADDARPSMSISPDVDPPVWLEKTETDKSYNWCLNLLIRAVKEDVERCEKAAGHTFVEKIGVTWGGTENTDKKPQTLPPPKIGVLFGTHNWTSCGLILKNLVDTGLAVTSDGREFNPEAGEVVKISDEAVERIAIGQLYGAFFRMRQGCLFTVSF